MRHSDQLAYKIEDEQRVTLKLIDASRLNTKETISRNVVILGLLLVLCQIVDATLTGLGISHFGLNIEANLLLRSLMEKIGYIEVLVISKTAAILVILSLCYLSNRVKWIESALRVLVFIYIFCAILPWGYILFPKII